MIGSTFIHLIKNKALKENNLKYVTPTRTFTKMKLSFWLLLNLKSVQWILIKIEKIHYLAYTKFSLGSLGRHFKDKRTLQNLLFFVWKEAHYNYSNAIKSFFKKNLWFYVSSKLKTSRARFPKVRYGCVIELFLFGYFNSNPPERVGDLMKVNTLE